MKMSRIILGVGALVLTGAGVGYLAGRARAAIPSTEVLTYSAVVTDAAGAPVTGTQNVQLQLWDMATDGNLKCSVGPSMMTLTAVGGFQVTLPANCITAVQATGDLWVEVIVNGESLGRSKLGAVPYAVEAGHALTANMATSVTPPTTTRVDDPRTGCPGPGAANTDLVTLPLTMTKSAPVRLATDIIRNYSGRADLYLLVDGTQVAQTLTYTTTLGWAPAHIEWLTTLAAGAHTVSIRSNIADVWGCGPTWGSISAIAFQ